MKQAASCVFTVLLGMTSGATAQCVGGWTALGSGLSYAPSDAAVYAILYMPDHSVVVGGEFNSAGGAPAPNLARYYFDSQSWYGFPGNFARYRGGSTVFCLARFGDGVAVGGPDSYVEGDGDIEPIRQSPVFRADIGAAISPDFSPIPPEGMGPSYAVHVPYLGGGAWPGIRAMTTAPDGDLIIGGEFYLHTSVGTLPDLRNLARFDLELDKWRRPLGATFPGIDAPGLTQALAVSGAYLYRAAPGGGLYRHPLSGPPWIAVNIGVGMDVARIAVLPDGDLVAAVSNLPAQGGGVTAGLARYGVQSGQWTPIGGGVSYLGGPGEIRDLAIWSRPDPEIIVGGLFDMAGPVPANSVARYKLSTGEWSPLGGGVADEFGGVGIVHALAVTPFDEVVVGGDFETAGGISAHALAKYSLSASGLTLYSGPESLATCESTAATFSLSVGGISPMAFQWRKDGVAVDSLANASAATATLVLPNVGPADNASYDCVVSNACGTVTSNAATLTVQEAPAGSIVPGADSILIKCDGDSMQLAAAPLGAGPFQYRWFLDTAPLTDNARITGATSANLIVSAMIESDGGLYSCRITSGGGCASTITGPLVGVLSEPAIDSHPTSQSACAGATATFSVVPSGPREPSYEWLKDGEVIEGAPSAATYVIAAVGAGDVGSYSCRLFNDCGSVTTNSATLTVANCCPGCPLPCAADIDNGSGSGTPDGGVDINDLLFFLASFEAGFTAADLDNGSGSGTPDGGIDINDLLFFLARFEAGC